MIIGGAVCNSGSASTGGAVGNGGGGICGGALNGSRNCGDALNGGAVGNEVGGDFIGGNCGGGIGCIATGCVRCVVADWLCSGCGACTRCGGKFCSLSCCGSLFLSCCNGGNWSVFKSNGGTGLSESARHGTREIMVGTHPTGGHNCGATDGLWALNGSGVTLGIGGG